MNRNSLMEMSGRLMHVVQRFTLNQSNDNPMMQTLHLDGMNTEFRAAVERVQHFGFTSTPLPRDQQQGQQGASGGNGASAGSGGTGGDGEAMKGPAAEGICLYVGGQRNHPVCIAIDDRRHRPMGLKPGENAQYDDIGQMTLLRRTGTYVLSLDDEQQQGSSGSARDSSGSGGSGSSSGQGTTRMVSLRHVQKSKQQRGSAGGSSGSGSSGSSGGGGSARDTSGSSGSGSSGQSQQDFQHEGQTVNTEVRATKNNVQILDGTTVVANYDKGSGTWTFTSKNITLHASSNMTLKCDAELDLTGHPLKINGGGPNAQPFTVP